MWWLWLASALLLIICEPAPMLFPPFVRNSPDKAEKSCYYYIHHRFVVCCCLFLFFLSSIFFFCCFISVQFAATFHCCLHRSRFSNSFYYFQFRCIYMFLYRQENIICINNNMLYMYANAMGTQAQGPELFLMDIGKRERWGGPVCRS